MTGGKSLLDIRILCDQAWIRGLPINKPEQFLHPRGLVGVATIHENFRFRSVCKHFLNSKRERYVCEAAVLSAVNCTPMRSEIRIDRWLTHWRACQIRSPNPE